jgi:hypothetical protein
MNDEPLATITPLILRDSKPTNPDEVLERAKAIQAEMTKTIAVLCSQATGLDENDLLDNFEQPTEQDQELMRAVWSAIDDIDIALDKVGHSVYDLSASDQSKIWVNAYRLASREVLGEPSCDKCENDLCECDFTLVCGECDLTDELWCETEWGICQDCCQCDTPIHLSTEQVLSRITPSCSNDLETENPALWAKLTGHTDDEPESEGRL